MSPKLLQKTLLGAAISSASLSAIAAETTFNGFASVVGGIALNQETLPFGCKAMFAADPGYIGLAVGEPGTTCEGDLDPTNQAGASTTSVNRKAAYSDQLSFTPDSNYGLQIKSDLNNGLSFTAQLTGRGSKDFQAELESAYLTYDFTPNTTLQAGRQRLPLYYYSDFFDVGYAYHWIRPPIDVYANTQNTFEGVSLTQRASFGSWSAQGRIYTGSAYNPLSRFGDSSTDSLTGGLLEASNDYLRLRASYVQGDFYVRGTLTDKSNEQPGYFGSLSAHLTLGNFFALVEGTAGGFHDDDAYFSTTPVTDVINPVDPRTWDRGMTALDSAMISAGWIFGDFTPHITYSQNTLELAIINPLNGKPIDNDELYVAASTWTYGLRWDFHPSADFKVEYSARTDDSGSLFVASEGKTQGVDVLSMGFDVIF
ncbi:hypothetical protein [Agaribacterium haliotis]|uniref:hypothetical protein n=1 Tax=Agaribacterium haliotis TaxID=2013869 RepID=UPI0011781669|nr:hypothetical protein [Agaribacterium haliotis]